MGETPKATGADTCGVSPAESDAWQQRAAFSVFFEARTHPGASPQWRTRVYHEESGDEVTLGDVEQSRWVAWIGERMRGGQPADTGAGSTAAPLTVRVTGVHPLDRGSTPAGDDELRLCAELTVSGLVGLAGALGAGLAEAIFSGRAP
jgi:hypothetical protein